MRRNIKTRFLTLSLILMFASASDVVTAQASKTNFSGNWTFNAEKSEMGQTQQGGGGARGGFGSGNVVITQEENLLTVERTRTGQDGQPITTTSKYTLDGKESINTTQRGESKSTATWSTDGKVLTIVTKRTFERDGQSMEITSTEVWTLSDPAVLSVVTTMITPNGERKTSAVYDKK